MNYKGKLKSGEEVLLQNDGDQTHIQVASGEPASQSNQGTSFSTGKWSQPPQLFAAGEGAYLQLESSGGKVFVEVKSGGVRRLEEVPNLSDSTEIPLHETDESPTPVDMKPMKPMAPMEPMKPLKPLFSSERHGAIQFSTVAFF